MNPVETLSKAANEIEPYDNLLAQLLDAHATEWADLAHYNTATTDGRAHPDEPSEAMQAALVFARAVLNGDIS